jgi:hypothetical protein
MPQSSEHFSKHELACKHCGECFVEQDLLDALEAFRSVVGAPVHIHSGYRCAQHNAEIGGAKGSLHVAGRAADVSVVGKTARQLKAIAETVPRIKGFGIDDHKNYLHIDVRLSDVACLWCYSEGGKTIPYYDSQEVA